MKPAPLDDNIRSRMERQRRADTAPEMAIRRELHRRGLRYRVDVRPPVPGVRSRADIIFSAARVVVFVDGCFWHGCPDHFTVPTNNREFWLDKIAANRARDQRNSEALAAAGYVVVRVWEHVDPTTAADEIERVVRSNPDRQHRSGHHAA